MDDESNTHSPQIDSGVKRKGPLGPAKLNANFTKQRNGDYFQHYEIDKKEVRGAFIEQALATFINKAEMSGFTVEKAGRLKFQYYIKERTQKRRVILKQQFKLIDNPSFEHYLKRNDDPSTWFLHTFCVRLTLEGSPDKIKISSCAWPKKPTNRYENAHFYTMNEHDDKNANPSLKDKIEKKVEFAIENLFTFQTWKTSTYKDVINSNITFFCSDNPKFFEKVKLEDQAANNFFDFKMTLTDPSNICQFVIDSEQPEKEQNKKFQEYGFLVRVFHKNPCGKWEIYSLRKELDSNSDDAHGNGDEKHFYILSSIFTKFNGAIAKKYKEEKNKETEVTCEEIFEELKKSENPREMVIGMAGSFFKTLSGLRPWSEKHSCK